MKIWKLADHELTITLMLENWKQDKEKFTENFIGNSIAQEWTPVKLFTSEKGKSMISQAFGCTYRCFQQKPKK